MNKNRVFTFFLIILATLLSSGCVSRGDKSKNPTIVFADRYNYIPADTPSQFLERYEYFITGKEKKEFKKLLTDEDRQEFIDEFWIERDIDPSTPENEYKQEIDKRIKDISNERFFSRNGTIGLLFRSNGGFRGEMAKVYLLHGEPDVMDTIDGQSFVPLMLWVYMDNNGGILYAFLFYHRNRGGEYFLFPQDAYKLDPCGALDEIAIFRTNFSAIGGNCPAQLTQVLNDVRNANGKGGFLFGYYFAWALFNFSQDGSIWQGSALEPPKSAKEFAKESTARVTGEAPEQVGISGVDYLLSSCKECNSFLPAELQLGDFFALIVKRGDMDWRISGENKDVVDVDLKVRVIFERANEIPLVFEKTGAVKGTKELVTSEPSEKVTIVFMTVQEVSEIPSGNYRVSVYIRNLMTGKYNSWVKEFVK
ncbi:MAG: hypothetical protein COV30_00310 [Candidatus Yanofskybacteria bacterium CG10_big_fil_rev_8_21_14_0_10_37_15]|uniref:GWxTD domain-containing protein n=1 Tax=Candidatus Yanofskybacteria bacterium CG10_big_fil_rev_8_21_14_0_10_37_15 TaxID=1975097 RepID=A0A2H0R6C8_9BACT|nr:MAG: hypothetical protein COV30_00310 [Candidatus Yanofskybacteria bacterium CG10_big_fil_rev_8_21_14_0_10_37_15]